VHFISQIIRKRIAPTMIPPGAQLVFEIEVLKAE
jgi:hypothetical protein